MVFIPYVEVWESINFVQTLTKVWRESSDRKSYDFDFKFGNNIESCGRQLLEIGEIT